MTGPEQTTLSTGGGHGPNEEQQRLIDTHDGVVLVDAGAGTGKTFTIARRYEAILETHGLDPDQVILITFTNNAAEEMRERILGLGSLPPGKLREAPISTFHSLARRLLAQHGFTVPYRLGIEEPLAPNFGILEDRVLEAEAFEAFLARFRAAHPEHEDRLAGLHDPTNLLDLVKSLASKGIVPTSQGWYRDGREHLLGDREAFMAAFEHANQRRGGRQSKLRSDLGKIKGKLTLPEAPSVDELREGDGKQVDERWAAEAFDQDRSGLLAFVHDVYVGYLTHCLEEDQLSFPFLLALAYVLLMEDQELREQEQRPYVMIDEFQDTSEIQFRLALLFCAEPNLCCVGDWKQSIYKFQYADVDNIRRFQNRLHAYTERLNEDAQRVPFAPDQAVRPIELVENYRSTDAILRLAEKALVVPGKKEEGLDEAAIREDIVELRSNAEHPRSRIEAIVSDEEVPAVLAKLIEIEGDEAYGVEGPDGELVAPSWGDMAVLTRTRRFALELQETAREIGVPMAFEGGVEIFSTDPGKLLLAWLRILADARSRRGWAVVLELAGYRLHEAKHILRTGDYPQEMVAFRETLADLSSLGARARAVFARYGLRDGITEALIETLQTSFETTGKAPGELVRFLEDSLEAKATVDVDDDHGDVVTVQTIHAAKGLEYPIVVLADLNEGRFPSTGGGYPSVIGYRDPIGLRQSKVHASPEGHPTYVYDEWATWFLKRCLPSTDYDEERRLLYVALSRAEQHVILSGRQDRPSPFLEHLPVEPEAYDQRPEPVHVDPRPEATALELPAPEAPSLLSLPVGQLVGKPEIQGGKGKAFGAQVHAFAARYARHGEPTPKPGSEQAHIAGVLDAMEGELEAEVACQLPLEIGGQRVVVEGKLDLLHRHGDRVEVVDWKTTPAAQGLQTYARQVGIYGAIVQAVDPKAEVACYVHYTEEAEPREVPVLSIEEVEGLVQAHLQA